MKAWWDSGLVVGWMCRRKLPKKINAAINMIKDEMA